MTKNAIATFLTCASLIVPTAAFADPDPKPFSTNQPGLLSSWLEKNFSDMTYFCLGGQKIKLKKGWSEKDTSSIPAIIAQKLNLTKPDAPKYKSFADATLTRLFGYVYKQNDSERGGIVADPGRYLPDNYSNTDDQIAEDGLGLLTYNVNCTSSLNSAASFNAGYSLAPVTLEAAARATLSRKFDQRASLTYGTFLSPIYRDWQVSTPTRTTGDRFRSAMLFWQWYRSNGVVAGKLLTSIIGWSFYRDVGSSSDDSIEAKASAGVSLPVLTATTRIDSAYDNDVIIRRKDYYFVMQDSGAVLQSHFEPIPPISQVIAAVKSSAQVRFAPVGDNIVRQNVEKLFTADVFGLPLGLCSSSYTPSQPSSGILLFRNAAPDTDKGFCRITLGYTPTSAMAGTQSFTFNLTWTESDLKPGVTPFAIPISATFVSSDKPRSQLESNFPVSSSSSTISLSPPRTVLSWKTNVRVFDTGLLQNSSQVKTRLYVENCGSNARVGDFRIDGSLLSRTLPDSVLLQIDVSADYAASVTAQWGTQLCELQGNIEYDIDGTWIPRPLAGKIQLVVPIEAPPSPQMLIREVGSAR